MDELEYGFRISMATRMDFTKIMDIWSTLNLLIIQGKVTL